MCSELLRIPIRLGGVPLFGFGVLLAAWIGFCGWLIGRAAKEVGWKSALAAHLPTAIFIAAGVAWAVPAMFPEGLPIRGYGVMVLCGVIVGMLMVLRRGEQVGVSAEDLLGVAVSVLVCGTIGARLFYVIEYWDDRIRQPTTLGTLKEIVKFTEGGLVIYGALFGTAVAFLWDVRRRKLPLLAMADLAMPTLLTGLAFGRIGCFLNGCCYGGETTLPWAVTFPRTSAPDSLSPPYAEQAAAGRFYGLHLGAQMAAHDRAETSPGEHDLAEVIVERLDRGSLAAASGMSRQEQILSINDQAVNSLADAHRAIFEAFLGRAPLEIRTIDGQSHTIPAVEPPPRSLPAHPAQLYSAVDAGLLAWLLWAYYPYRRREGEVLALMLTIHPIARFLLEIVRVDESAVFGTGLSISQNISILLFALGMALWFWLSRQPRRLDFPRVLPTA